MKFRCKVQDVSEGAADACGRSMRRLYLGPPRGASTDAPSSGKGRSLRPVPYGLVVLTLRLMPRHRLKNSSVSVRISLTHAVIWMRQCFLRLRFRSLRAIPTMSLKCAEPVRTTGKSYHYYSDLCSRFSICHRISK